jgi:predicted metal-dependent phosphoesterase TrpH
MKGNPYPVDLHAHSTCSDGALAPAAVVRLAVDAGVKALALTDHDTIEGLPEARAAAADAGLQLIDGVEISCWYGREIHVLAYFVDPNDAHLRAVLADRKAARLERAHTMSDRLARLGAPIDVKKLLASAEGNIGRPHVARALLDAGHVRTFDEAFTRFLGRDAPAYVTPSRFETADAIALVHDCGGVAVLAHPGVEGIDDSLPRLVDMGLDGIEAVHPAHDEGQRRKYRRLAEKYGLVPTGGTDFHGPNESWRPGTCGVGFDTLEALERRRPNRQVAAS